MSKIITTPEELEEAIRGGNFAEYKLPEHKYKTVMTKDRAKVVYARLGPYMVFDYIGPENFSNPFSEITTLPNKEYK